jgi:hypothetical protein
LERKFEIRIAYNTTMGDDLGSDDEGWMQNVDASGDEDSKEDDDRVDQRKSDRALPSQPDKKRKLEEDSSVEPKAKTKKNHSIDKVLVEAGRNIETSSKEEQAAFLTTAIKHYSLLASGSTQIGESLSFLPDYFRTSSKESLAENVRDAVSMKQLKAWKNTGSPCVVIVCISARRAVAVLKELSSLKLRVAKLFPKSGSLAEQKDQLRLSPFGVAVGTPHRLAVLAGCTEDAGRASLSFKQTQLVVFDSHLSNKQFSVVSTTFEWTERLLC